MEITEIKSKPTLAQVLQHDGLKSHRRRTTAVRRWNEA